jgi:hypothetical protein
VDLRLALAVDDRAVGIDEREAAIVREAAAGREPGGGNVGAVERFERVDAQPRDVRCYDARTSASPSATEPPCTTRIGRLLHDPPTDAPTRAASPRESRAR